MGSTSIVVVGSCMMDFVSYAPRLPKEGETIHGTKFVTTFGGKGANQCVAAAKLGGTTALVARVGDDIWGDKYIENLKRLKVDTSHVKKTQDSSSGIAQITVSETGQNQIVIVAGANNYLGIEDVDQAHSLISKANVVVLQLETSIDVALRAAELCLGISILNGAPGLSEFHPRLLKAPTIFCVNETEAAIFSGLTVNDISEAEKAAEVLISKGCKSVILTLGAGGAIYVDESKQVTKVSCPSVKCVDSTGAGDAFIGALAYLLAYHSDIGIRKVLEIACFVASDSVTRPGTQISFPGREILKQFSLK